MLKWILPLIAFSTAAYAGYENHRLNLQLANYQSIAYPAEMDGDSLVLHSLSTRSAMPTDLTVTPLFADQTKAGQGSPYTRYQVRYYRSWTNSDRAKDFKNYL